MPDEQCKHCAERSLWTMPSAFIHGKSTECKRIIDLLDNPPSEYNEAVGDGYPASANEATDWWAAYLARGVT